MKIIIIVFLISFFAKPVYSQDFVDDSSYVPQENQVDESVLEQQRIENEERAREAQMIQDQQPPPENYDNSGEYGF